MPGVDVNVPIRVMHPCRCGSAFNPPEIVLLLLVPSALSTSGSSYHAHSQGNLREDRLQFHRLTRVEKPLPPPKEDDVRQPQLPEASTIPNCG
jgi:hypothetical protein